VFAIAHLHEKLQEAENHTIIDIKEYISGLAGELSQTYQLDEKKINITFQMENVLIDAKTAVACGLIMNEILTNAVKYAFPGGRPGNIYIGFKHEGGKYSYSIRDDGVGLPEDYDHGRTGSLGLLLIRSLVGSSRGTLEITTGTGTEFKIILPVLPDNGERNEK
jgi:two-component sensor histidine kinase